MNVWKLRLTMAGTLAIIIGISTVFLAVFLQFIGLLDIITLTALVALFNVVQWLFAPYLINAIYRVKDMKTVEHPKVKMMIERLSNSSGVKKPKLGIASIPIPNAFAYGSPLTGNHVALTQGLLETLNEEEIEAVLAHEIGHLKHRDVQIMMLISFLPSLFYLLGRSFLYSAYFGGYYGRNNRNSGSGITVLMGSASMAAYFLMLLFTLRLSRLREYYADNHSASIVEDGPRNLSQGLAKIFSKTAEMRSRSKYQQKLMFSGFKTLFIADPDSMKKDSPPQSSDKISVDRLLNRRITTTQKITELFSTHPNITKRLRALRALEPSRTW